MLRPVFSIILLTLAWGLAPLHAQTKERPIEGKPDALRDLSMSLETLARRAPRSTVCARARTLLSFRSLWQRLAHRACG